jgi:DNA polymerase III epsilon subunit-like protein
VILVDHNYEIIDHFQAYVLPEPNKLIHQGAVEVNGYTPEFWAKNGSPLAEVRKDLAEWLGDRTDIQAIAYNAPFDKAWCDAYLPGLMPALRPQWADALVAYRAYIKEAKGVTKPARGQAKLGAACEDLKYGESTSETWARHTALDDCYATRFVSSVLDLNHGLLANTLT